MFLVTLADVKTFIGDSGLGSTYDDELNLRIQHVTRRAGTFCNRNFEQASYTEIHDGGESRIYPDNPPIVSVTSLVWDDFGDFSAGFTIPTADYLVVNRGWDIASTAGPFPGGQHGLQLAYVGGYLTASNASSVIPADLSGAIAQQVVYEFRRRKDTGLTDVSMPNGDITKVAERDFLPLVKDVLKSYRVPHIG